MKSTTFISILVACTLFLGCANAEKPLTPDEKKLIGDYYCSFSKTIEQSADFPSMSLILEGYSYYKSDRTCKDEGTLKVLVKMKSEDMDGIVLEFKISSEGTWNIEDGYLSGVMNPKSFKFEYVKSNAPADVSKKLEKMIGSMMDFFSTSLKAELMKGDKSKILQWTDEKLVLEQDGEEITLVKIK